MATALASQDPFSMPAKAWFKDPVEHAFKMRESHAGRHAADAEGLCEAAALRNAYAQVRREPALKTLYVASTAL
jgi:hypothetical protein